MANLTFLEYFAKYNGKIVDVDGAYGGQCMDCMHLYLMECFGLTKATLAAPTAREVYVNFPNVPGSQYFEKIPNYWWTVPKQGWIAFWKEPVGPYKDEKGVLRYAGHVAVVNEGNMKRFSSMDQNWGSDRRCRLIEHNYSNIAGFLRFKGQK